jgi:antitoxin HicB
MQTWVYPAVVTEKGPGEILARFPDVPEALTSGATIEEALANAADALEEVILHRLAHGEEIPLPRKAAKGEVPIPLDPVTAGRAAVATLLVRQRMTNVALAARMGKDEKVVRRILDGAGNVSMANVSSALKALGAKPALTVSEG